MSMKRTLTAILMTWLTSVCVAQELGPVLEADGYRLPLGWLQGSHEPIELRGASALQRLAIPLSRRYALEEARLELTLTRSLALNRRSQLAIAVNGRVYAQLPLAGEGTEQLARIRLPVDALGPGYPELGLRVAQHYTDACEDSGATELYTQIDAGASALFIKAARRVLSPSLARLGEVFDRRLWLAQYPLELYLPPGEAGAALLPAAAEAVQAVAARLEYLPLRVQVRHLPAAAASAGEARFPGLRLQTDGWDAVLLGTRDMLRGHLHAGMLAQIRSPFLGIFSTDQDPSRYVLVVSGLTPEQVERAARILNLGAALPDAAAVGFERVVLPTPPSSSSRAAQRLRFAELGQPSVSFRGSTHPSISLQFWALREWLDPAAPFIELTLNYAYGAGLDNRSALNVLLNGQFVQALPLGDPDGAQVRGARVRLPTIALRDGSNELRLEASLHGREPGGECMPRFSDHLRLTVFEDSSLDLPALAGRIRFPDLAIMARTAQPYADPANRPVLLLTDIGEATLSAALTWLGKLRQVARTPLPPSSLRLAKPEEPAPAMATWIGPLPTLPAAVRAQAPQFMPPARWQQISMGLREHLDLEKGLESWLRRPFAALLDEARTVTPVQAVIGLEQTNLPGGALIQFIDREGRPATVLTADDAGRLQAGVARLVRHAAWNGLQGAAVAWNTDGELYAWVPPTETVLLGEMPVRLRLSHALSDRPWLLLAILLALIGVLVATAGWLLRQRAARRLRQR